MDTAQVQRNPRALYGAVTLFDRMKSRPQREIQHNRESAPRAAMVNIENMTAIIIARQAQTQIDQRGFQQRLRSNYTFIPQGPR